MVIDVIKMTPEVHSWEQVCTVLTPYWVASAEETTPNDPLDLDYETYGSLYDAGKLHVYIVSDNDTGNIVGYCLAIPMRGLTTAVRSVEIISLYLIRDYRGAAMHTVMRALKRRMAGDHPDCKYMTIGLPQNETKFCEPCYLLCRIPLRRD